ncbi:hypothetical protein M409DRAFT_69481 [Zasmidium cellare ATCC 36951]|uniref:Cellular morphogenesis protein n=1 Tax=Zasmidium cellare ATCC 36951 TaxID=1080233 RepID=A0A6A6C701_ZASCE|nr:uncharacterized protein M409DRAFT_69481 [Zasmidium cellare ATCC 36951]KAF2161980.1 hypothetical protein M409DRAFT_69481 [Zasmidium cellare ATCC 36951]
MRNLLAQLLAVGPELATYILTVPLLAARPTYALTQTAASSPNLDLQQLGRVAIGGDFDSVSLYTYEGQNENLSSNGSQSLLTRYPNGAFESLALVDADASIAAMCSFISRDGTNNGVVLGGNFTSVGGQKAGPIALWNPNTNVITDLPGLTGQVHALYCDQYSTTVYVGGNFMGGNSTNSMAWTTGWQDFPFAGFNGPVNSITKNSAGNIVFGGEFTGLGDATTPSQPDAQVVNLLGGTITGFNTAASSDPRSIICSTADSGNQWLLADDTAGYWEGQYGFGFNPTKLRLYNAQGGHGTKSWYFERLDDGGILNFTYVDPTTGQNSSCSQSCPLPENNSTAQDFHFVNTVGVSGLRIYVTEWYGSSGGLSGIEIFQDDIYSYAVANFNEPKCDGISNGSSSVATPNSTWTEVANRDLTPANFLSAYFTNSDSINASTNVVFQPNIQQSGNYSVMMYTPGCIMDGSCGTRGQVNITGSMTSDTAPITTTLFQTNNYDKFDQIYYGYIDTDNFSPEVTLSPVSGQSAPLTVVASRVRFDLVSTTGGLNGLYEYTPGLAANTDDFSKSAINSAGSNLNDQAMINAVIQDEDNETLYVAGDFAGGDVHNVMSVKENGTALPGGGLNGQVAAMQLNGSRLYLGGTFSNTQDNSVTGLNNLAVFSIDENVWTPLGAGVSGSVFDITPLPLNISDNNLQNCFAISGNFTSVNEFSDNAAFDAEGFAVWVPAQSNWLNNIANASLALNGFLTAWATVPDMAPVYAGTIKSQGSDYGDVVELVGSGVPGLQSLGVRLEPGASSSSTNSSSTKRKRALTTQSSGRNYTGVYEGLFYGDNNLNITIIGGNFATNMSNGSTINNLIFINATNNGQATVSGTSGLDSDSIFVAMDTYNTMLFAGGAVNGTVNGNDATGLVVYDLSANAFANPHPPALGGDNVVVNVIATQPDSSNVFVGGSFQTAGSLQCETLCSYDAGVMQWQNTGAGLSGTINAMFWSSKTQLIIAGNLTVNGNATTMATYDAKKQTFEEYTGASTLPGPISAISAVSSDYDQFWVSGVATSNSSTYLAKYQDGVWTGAGGLGDSTTIRKLQIMPLTSPHATSDLMSADQSLLILGDVNIPTEGNASAVLFNGTTYEPYILTNMNDGSQGSLSAIFVGNPQYFMEKNDHHLALGLVVLIGLAISLAIIFFIVVAGILIERRRRRKEGYVPMTATFDRSNNIARVPPESLFHNLEGKPSPPKL